MRIQLAFFLIAMISMSVAFNHDISFLRQLKRQKFGRTIIETIQLQLSTSGDAGNAIDNIVQLLLSLRGQTVDEQSAHLERNSEFQAEQAAIQENLEEEISGLEDSIESDNNLLTINAQTEQHLENYLADQQDALESSSNDLSENQDQQAETTQSYEDNFNALADQLTALAQAKQILAQLQVAQPGSDDLDEMFLQVSKRMKNIQFKHPKYQSMINVLAQLMQSSIVSDQGLVDTILDLITTLQAQLRLESDTLTANYKQRIQDLGIIESNLEDDIALEQSNIQQTTETLAQLALDDSNAKLRIQQNQQSLDDDEDQLEDSQQAASDAQKDFDAQTKRRNDELSIYDEVIEIFQVRFSEDVRSLVTAL